MQSPSRPEVSAALQAAQQKLLQRRQQQRAWRQAQELPRYTADAGRHTLPAPANPAGAPQPLPPHLGWHSPAVTAAIRARTGVPAAPSAPAVPAAPTATRSNQPAPPRPTTPAASPAAATFTLAPTLAQHILQHKQTAASRVWFWLRHLDAAGRGWFDLPAVYQALTTRSADSYLCGGRRLRQLLRQGEDVFWQRRAGRLWLRAPARVAAALGATRWRGRPLKLPLSRLQAPLPQLKADFYHAFHQSRRAAPVARATLKRLTGLAGHTQRKYEKQTRIQVRRNFALGPRLDTIACKEVAWHKGPAAFSLQDHQGRHGQPGRHYLAWQLPNRYICTRPAIPAGRHSRQQKRRLADLNVNGDSGNGQRQPATPRRQRHFCHDGAEAAILYNRNRADGELYYPAVARQPGDTHCWHCLNPESA